MKKLLRFWPLLFIIGLWLVFSAPYFFNNLVPYPSRYQVSFFPPWNAYEQYWGPVKNNAMPDVIDQIYPWKYFTIESMKSGLIPLWNPYNFAGNPHVANFQSAVFSPFNLLYFVLPFVDAWSIVVLLQPLLAAIFMYLFLRELKVAAAGAVLGSVTFMFSGFMVVWMAYGTLSMAITFLPLALWGIEKGFIKNRWYFSVMTLAVVTSFFSGHFQTSLYFVLLCGSYLLFRSIVSRDKKAITAGAIFYGLGFILSLPQLYPTIIFYQNSVRSGLVYQGGGIPLDYIITALAPDFYGNPVTRNDWRGNYAEWASFVGIVPLLFALFSIRKNKDGGKRWFFLGAGVVALLFAMDTPLHNLLTATHLPIIATSIPSRLIILFSFCVAVLAGFGLSDFQSASKKFSIKNFLPQIIALSLVILGAFLSVGVFKLLPEDKNMLALKNLVLPAAMFVAVLGLILIRKFFSARKVLIILIASILLLASFDSYRFASKWMPFEPKAFVFPDVPVIAAMQDKIGYGRVYGNLGTEVTTYYGLPSLEGYDPLYTQRYGEFIMYSRQGTFMPAERSVVRLDRRGKYTDRVLDLLGVNMIFHPLADTGQEWAYPVWEDFEKYSVVYQDTKHQVYRNNTALPRAKLYYQAEVITEDKELLKQFYSPRFDFRQILLLEEDVHGLPNDIANATGSAEIVSYTPNVVGVRVKTNQAGLLFLSDTYYPGWEVSVNGKQGKLLRANYSFRAVEVPPGESDVTFSF